MEKNALDRAVESCHRGLGVRQGHWKCHRST